MNYINDPPFSSTKTLRFDCKIGTQNDTGTGLTACTGVSELIAAQPVVLVHFFVVFFIVSVKFCLLIYPKNFYLASQFVSSLPWSLRMSNLPRRHHIKSPKRGHGSCFFFTPPVNTAINLCTIMSTAAKKLLPRTNNGTGAFVLQCRRLVFNYCEHWGSNKGMV